MKYEVAHPWTVSLFYPYLDIRIRSRSLGLEIAREIINSVNVISLSNFHKFQKILQLSKKKFYRNDLKTFLVRLNFDDVLFVSFKENIVTLVFSL